jgi:hypothetical protein
MIVLPMHLALPAKMTDCTFGSLRHFNSDTPELVVQAAEVRLLLLYNYGSVPLSSPEATYSLQLIQGIFVFKGKFEFPSNKYLSIACQPSTAKKTGQSMLTDVFDRILTFEKVRITPLVQRLLSMRVEKIILVIALLRTEQGTGSVQCSGPCLG